MFAAPPRFPIYFLLVVLLISSCSTSSPSDAYPTYDPFAPINGTGTQGASIPGSNVMQPLGNPGGPTPTRAPVSVQIPHSNSNLSTSTTPTPDSPHALPTQRDFIDQYTVQSGDTLGSISQ